MLTTPRRDALREVGEALRRALRRERLRRCRSLAARRACRGLRRRGARPASSACRTGRRRRAWLPRQPTPDVEDAAGDQQQPAPPPAATRIVPNRRTFMAISQPPRIPKGPTRWTSPGIRRRPPRPGSNSSRKRRQDSGQRTSGQRDGDMVSARAPLNHDQGPGAPGEVERGAAQRPRRPRAGGR